MNRALVEKIKMVLETPLGSIPHLPWLGSTIHEHIDQPENVAIPGITSAAYQALANCLPEIHITSIHFLRQDQTSLLVIKITHNNREMEVTHAIS